MGTHGLGEMNDNEGISRELYNEQSVGRKKVITTQEYAQGNTGITRQRGSERDLSPLYF